MVIKKSQGHFFAPAHQREQSKILQFENACLVLSDTLMKYEKSIQDKEAMLSTHTKLPDQMSDIQYDINEMIAKLNYTKGRLVALKACLLELQQQQPEYDVSHHPNKIHLLPPNGAK